MDVATRMSAFQSFYLYFTGEISGRYVYFFISKLGNGVYTACAADEQFSLIFGIEVQENVTAHEALLQGKGAGQSCFLIYGEQAFDRAVFNAVVSENSQLGCYTDAVIRSQRRTFGF